MVVWWGGVCLVCGLGLGLGWVLSGMVVSPWGREIFVKHDANQREIN